MAQGSPSKKTCCTPAREAVLPPPNSAISQGAEDVSADPIPIPGGSGLVGTATALLPVDGEGPLRKARLKPFAMEACVVTNARFRRFVEATGYETDAERIGNSFVFEKLLPEGTPPAQAVAAVPWWRVIEGATWACPNGPGTEDACHPDHPVVHVTWNDAQAFATWAGGRLPTEAEWEHAARGGLGDVRFPWGDDEPNDTDFFPCNIWQGRFPTENSEGDGYVATAPARSFEPNGYGLYNMVGNVWEYMSQPFKVRSLKKSVQRAHAGKEGFKLSKGGSFLCHASYCYRYRIAARTGTSADSSTSHQGFRLVFDI